MRKVININKSWRFIREDKVAAMEKDYNDDNWEVVNIPHTWNAFDGANGFDFFKGSCWYRKEFIVDRLTEGKKVFIEFEAANSITDVYVNGKYMGQHKGGYSAFRFDISDVIEVGTKNILVVNVNNTVVDDVYPQMADFTFYGGIYRDVNIVIVDNIHFDLMDYGSKGIYVIQEEVSKEKALLTIKSKLVNDTCEEKKVRLWVDIFDAEGTNVTYVSKEVVLVKGETRIVSMPILIENPTLWNARKNAYMYEAQVSIVSFNDTVDQLSIPFGVRYFKVDAEKGFFLNGEHLALNGVSRHQDRKDMGWAITHKEQEEDMELIKEIGATSIRLAHYQHNRYFYDLCDKEGMVVWGEIPFISIMSKNELEGINAKQQMTELIRQNYNHPSIMFWGIQNEIQIGGERAEVRKLVKELNELTKEEDPTRLTTMANVMFVSEEDEYNHITDIVGFNKYYGWYQGKTEDFAGWLDEYHEINPNVKLGISEYGAEGILQYHNSNPKIKDYTEEYHTLFHETVWKIFKERPFLWSTYVWNMFDFGANIRDEGGVKGRNNKGLITYDRKIKKDAFYMYKAHWAEKKFVHITSKRFVDRVEQEITVKVYSNCDEITIYINGKELETKKNDKIFIFENILLHEGINEIKAVSYENGMELKDVARFNKVYVANKSYEAPEEVKGGMVANWFDMPDVGNIKVEELTIAEDVYSTHCTFKDLMENEETKLVLFKYLGDFSERPMYGMMQGMRIDMIATMAEDMFTEELMYILNKELTKVKKL